MAAGTGVVTLAVGPESVARVDGWGHIMGDAGSGYWIGREALDAAMRHYDGRGQATALTDAVKQRWPILSDAYIDLQSSPDRVRIVASFAAVVAELADSGDAVAQHISDRAAEQLAASALTSLRVVAARDHTLGPVCAIGGVFRSSRLSDTFRRALEREGSTVVQPFGDGLDGVVTLSSLPEAHPLAAHIHRAAT